MSRNRCIQPPFNAVIARSGLGQYPTAPYEKLFMSGHVGYIRAFSMRPVPKTLIFLHIPKTGGTTFRRILESNYTDNEIRTLNGADYSVELELFAQCPEAIRCGYRAIQGHLYFGFHRFVPNESAYITWVRDPIARALSFYSHARTRTDHYLHRQLMEEGLDLKELLERRATPELFNLQTRMIAGERNPAPVVDRNTLQIAKQNLEKHFYFVGLTEEFDAGLVMLGEMLGWNIRFYLKKNVAREPIAPETLDPKTESLLREANAYDFELHQFARDLFEARRRAAGKAFESKLAQLQRVNSIGASAQRHYGKIKTALKSAVVLRAGPRHSAALKQSPTGPSI